MNDSRSQMLRFEVSTTVRDDCFFARARFFTSLKSTAFRPLHLALSPLIVNSGAVNATHGITFAAGLRRDFLIPSKRRMTAAGNETMPSALSRLGHLTHPRVAVVRALQLGDVLCVVPAWRALRAALPQAELTLIGLPWARGFVARFAHIFDHFLEFPGYPGIPEQTQDGQRLKAFERETAANPFDLVIQMHGSGWDINNFVQVLGARQTAGFYPAGGLCPDSASYLCYPEAVPEVERHLQLVEYLGAPRKGNHLEFPLTAEDEQQFSQLCSEHELTPGQYVCVHPGARWPSRRWPAERFSETADRLADHGFKVLLTGAAAEQVLVETVSQQMQRPHVNLAGRTALGLTVRLLRSARLLVSNDTGISHLAAAAQTPSVVVVLGSDPDRWAPLDRQLHRIILHPVECRPCEHFVCPIDHHCATKLSTDRVFEMALTILERDRNLSEPGRRAAALAQSAS